MRAEFEWEPATSTWTAAGSCCPMRREKSGGMNGATTRVSPRLARATPRAPPPRPEPGARAGPPGGGGFVHALGRRLRLASPRLDQDSRRPGELQHRLRLDHLFPRRLHRRAAHLVGRLRLVELLRGDQLPAKELPVSRMVPGHLLEIRLSLAEPRAHSSPGGLGLADPGLRFLLRERDGDR